MNACKCDVCGNFYETRGLKAHANMYVYNPKTDTDTDMDLCENCLERVLDVLNRKQVKI